MKDLNSAEVKSFLDALGLKEEPMGMHYTDHPPPGGFSPKEGILPTIQDEKEGQVDFGALFADFSCVIGNIWRARVKGTAAYFSKDQFGCIGGAFYLGFLKPQLEFITHYVSSGIPGQLEGERYLESPDTTRRFFNTIDPPAAPSPFCVFKPVSHFSEDENPELVTFFARGEIVGGLNQMATFVTNDFEAVYSPFGAGCSNMVTWPLKYMAQGRLKAVLGGWDPSDRRYLKPDEITFTVPLEMFKRMVRRWPESFLTTKTWATVKKKIQLSEKVWREV